MLDPYRNCLPACKAGRDKRSVIAIAIKPSQAVINEMSASFYWTNETKARSAKFELDSERKR